MPCDEVVVVGAVRTPIDKGHPEKGIYQNVRADDLGVACVRALVARTRFDLASIEDVIFGCANQQTSLQAVNFGAQSIMTGNGDVIVAGGVEHMGHIPIGKRLTATLLHELQRRGGRFGLAAMCIGFGQGIATIFERA